jgi:NAD(P)-dependent dehydrogenase (short-subunit alcohol dehydrogenase family)
MNNCQEVRIENLQADLLRKFDFSHRTALVTGGGSGLGRRIGSVLASLGAWVFFADLNEESARESASYISSVSYSRVASLHIDVTNPASVRESFRIIKKERNICDILVCSAGISGSKWIEDMELDRWQRVLDVNLTGTFLCCQAAVKSMIAHRWGRIINIASIASRYAPWPKRYNGAYNYSASKAGVVAMSRRLAVELAPYNITVNCISPGITRTPMTEKSVSDEEVFRQIIDHVPMRRLGKPEDLDGLVMYLCSDLSEYLTGQEIFIDGGYSLW